MGREAEKKPDPSGERLLNSIDEESRDGDSVTLWKEATPWYRSSRLRIPFIGGLIILALGITVIIQSVKLSKRHPATVTGFDPGQSGRCGFNSTEAIARGCVFDYMNFSWQPPECYDPELDEKHATMMRKDGPIRWWADANLTKPIPDDANILKMYTEVWTERKFHYKHCLYSWEILHLSYNDGRPIPDLMSHEHSLHCAMILDKAIRVDDGTELLLEHAVTWYSACIWPRA
ncbi:uncharacterized protein TRIVIDRAFT_53560 [Trichoderma virens Gv29-8]|uniref:Uncharacterized protein n=1 Tax=Hypocrea virens (strain Gv29-8 / FGSC 10586) TaxID=413071 RepID=G9MU84_HYPVG|nr:uncharacterized protein TRIVIDRAFT_53560 [Trichoderma virens Gv29-8]EHK21990.1 hypothetical protein TRIVIDRAFT_53560 [Trichoderma virens Gv29-8]UKZ48243.1 hypothetical protein TrVGV298_002479 [Trichoderma virens]UKZ74782.1 hypothetical protein TrVFT333_002452 [Trichoderma virens FT-333]